MEQQYMTRLADAYKTGYNKIYGATTKAPEMKLYYFKAKETLPRVQVVLSFMQGIVAAGQCNSLLDVGSGRGVFLFPLIEKFPDLDITSLEILPHRAKKISPKADQGYVANLAREQAKEYLRRHQPFVWNATNLTGQMRESLIDLFETYKAKVRIVYLETDYDTQLERNLSRPDSVPPHIVAEMLGKLTPPETFEAEKVEWISV